MSPQEVDDLWFVDFLILVIGCEARLKVREKSAEGGVWVG